MAHTTERKFYQQWWFSILLVIVASCLTLWFDLGRALGILAPVLGFFMLLALAYPRICPWLHRRIRISFRLDDPEQKRKAGLPADD